MFHAHLGFLLIFQQIRGASSAQRGERGRGSGRRVYPTGRGASSAQRDERGRGSGRRGYPTGRGVSSAQRGERGRGRRGYPTGRSSHRGNRGGHQSHRNEDDTSGFRTGRASANDDDMDEMLSEVRAAVDTKLACPDVLDPSNPRPTPTEGMTEEKDEFRDLQNMFDLLSIVSADE